MNESFAEFLDFGGYFEIKKVDGEVLIIARIEIDGRQYFQGDKPPRDTITQKMLDECALASLKSIEEIQIGCS